MKSLFFKCLIFAAIVNFGIIVICSSPEDTKADVQKNMIVVCEHEGGGYSYTYTSQYPPPPGICDADAKPIAVIFTDSIIGGGDEEPISNPSIETVSESDVVYESEEVTVDHYIACKCELKGRTYDVVCVGKTCDCCEVLKKIEGQLPID